MQNLSCVIQLAPEGAVPILMLPVHGIPDHSPHPHNPTSERHWSLTSLLFLNLIICLCLPLTSAIRGRLPSSIFFFHPSLLSIPKPIPSLGYTLAYCWQDRQPPAIPLTLFCSLQKSGHCTFCFESFRGVLGLRDDIQTLHYMTWTTISLVGWHYF